MVLGKPFINTPKVLEEIERQNLALFTPAIFARFFGVNVHRAAVYLSENTRRKIFVRPKRGFYFSRRFPPAQLEIANAIYKPSYVSLEVALSYYHLIPETIYSATSITTKHSKEFRVLNQVYTYHKLSKRLFFGYKIVKISGRPVAMATKEKALLDYLYFVARGQKKYNERFNLSTIDWQKLQPYSTSFFKNIHNKYTRRRFGILLNQVKPK